MSQNFPAHHENDATLALGSLQVFEIDASPGFTPRPARPRPPDRPRIIPTAEEAAGHALPLIEVECDASESKPENG